MFNPQRPPGKTRWTRPVPAPMLRGALLCVLVCGSVAFSTTPHPLVRPHLPRHAATPLHRPASAMQQFATAAASARTSPQAVVDALRAPLTRSIATKVVCGLATAQNCLGLCHGAARHGRV